MSLPVQKKPWEQWPDETDTAYQRFSVYLELGPERTQQKVVDKLGKSRGYEKQLQKWSSKHDWVARCREYDKHIIKQNLKNKEDIIDHARGRLLQKVDEALDVLFEIMTMEDYTASEGLSSNVTNKLKAVDMVLKKAGIVEPTAQIEPGKNSDDATYIQNIYNHIENHYGKQ